MPADRSAASRKAWETRRSRATLVPPTFLSDPIHPYLSGNAFVCGDNLDILRELPDECVDLIYADPPFNSNHNYVAAFGDKGGVDTQLRDIWQWTVETERAYQRLSHGPLLDAINAIRLISGPTSPMAAYALFMGRRLAELWRVLKPTGSVYLHCDPTANWCLRILLDKTFGNSHFRNEIVWRIGWVSGFKTQKRGWIRNHDTILYYTKSVEADRRFIKEYLPYPADYIRRDGKQPTGKGIPIEDTWNCNVADVLNSIMIMSFSTEKVGYPTQKPLALLERIVKASCPPEGLVLDPFCGCGTAADAAAKLGRGYLGIDVSAIAVRVMEQRLASRGGAATPVVYKLGWEDYEWEVFERRALIGRADSEDGRPGHEWAEDKVAGLLNAVPNAQKVGDGGVDARYYAESDVVIPIQVKMHKRQIGRPDLDRLLGVQASWENQQVNSPMSVMVTLYPPRDGLRVFAEQQGQIALRGKDYPVMQVLSVQEMLTKEERPKLPPVDPRWLVGNTQTRLAMV